jgi:hypothetical protein
MEGNNYRIMTTHGAYTQLIKSMRRVRGFANDSSKNLKHLFGTESTGSLAEDAEVTQHLVELTEIFRAMEGALEKAYERSATVARNYLEKSGRGATRRVLITEGEPSMRLRRRSKDPWAK